MKAAAGGSAQLLPRLGPQGSWSPSRLVSSPVKESQRGRQPLACRPRSVCVFTDLPKLREVLKADPKPHSVAPMPTATSQTTEKDPAPGGQQPTQGAQHRVRTAGDGPALPQGCHRAATAAATTWGQTTSPDQDALQGVHCPPGLGWGGTVSSAALSWTRSQRGAQGSAPSTQVTSGLKDRIGNLALRGCPETSQGSSPSLNTISVHN